MKRIGPYELIRRIGYGGMGEVWKARRRSFVPNRHFVALKLIDLEGQRAEGRYQQFLSEVRLSTAMLHPNIVQVLDAGEARHCCWLAMELIEGMDLRQLRVYEEAETGTMPVAAVGFIVHELLVALEYAHRLDDEPDRGPVIHRDVSPHNVMLSRRGEVKLSDFGVASSLANRANAIQGAGKLRYAAPEIIRGELPWTGADLYGVGAILHELLECQRFRDELDELGLVRSASQPRMPELEHCKPPTELEALRRALLDPFPDRRVSSASEALDILRSWPDLQDARTLVGELVGRKRSSRRGEVGFDGSIGTTTLSESFESTLEVVPDVADSSPDVVVRDSSAASRPTVAIPVRALVEP